MDDQQLQALSAQIGEKLKQRNATVTCAESCTGDGLPKSLPISAAAPPGSSGVL